MTSSLTPDQRAQWVRDGYLLLRGALSPAHVRGARKAVDTVYRAYQDGEIQNLSRDRETATIFPPQWRWIDPHWNRDAVAFRRWTIIEDDPFFISLIDHDAFFPLILELMGPFIQLGMTHAIVLPPNMKDKPYLHVDGGESLGSARTDASSRPLSIRVQMFLTDLEHENCGNFMAVPGSHRHPLPPDALHNCPAHLSPVQFRVRAGDIICWTHSLWHGAAANEGQEPRKTLIFSYMQRFMKPYDYEMISTETLARCTPRQRLLLGDLGGWHWRAGCHYYENEDFAEIMSGTGSLALSDYRTVLNGAVT
jgi:hypothetical protein